jgi:hypothetical protein
LLLVIKNTTIEFLITCLLMVDNKFFFKAFLILLS